MSDTILNVNNEMNHMQEQITASDANGGFLFVIAGA